MTTYLWRVLPFLRKICLGLRQKCLHYKWEEIPTLSTTPTSAKTGLGVDELGMGHPYCAELRQQSWQLTR